LARPDAPADRLDLPTLIAIGVVVYVLKNLIHEALGHGGVCVLVGGEPIAVSSAWWDADYASVSTWGRRWVKAGGTLANLIFGGAALAAWPWLTRGRSAAARYFWWLFFTANLLSGGGYMMVDPLGNFGDWKGFLEGLEPNLPLRLGIVAAGVAISLGAVFAARRRVEPFLGTTARTRRIKPLTWAPYFSGGLLFTVAALFNPLGHVFVSTSALATFGGTAWLAWFLPFIVDKAPADAQDPPLGLPPTRGWWIAGAAAGLFTLFVLGPSIRF
jgi:hypothetical protein